MNQIISKRIEMLINFILGLFCEQLLIYSFEGRGLW